MRIRRLREHFCENVIYLQITCVRHDVFGVCVCGHPFAASPVDARRIKFNLKNNII